MVEQLLLSLLLAQVPAPPLVSELEGTWSVRAIDQIAVMPDAPVTLTFRGTRISGVATCNSFQGTVIAVKGHFKADNILATLKACDGARMSQERDFLSLLRSATTFEVGDDVLTLTTAAGKQLTANRSR